MPDPLDRVRPGEVSTFVTSATTANVVLDLARLARANRQGKSGPGQLQNDPLVPANLVYVKWSGSTLLSRSIVKISDPVISAVDYPVRVQASPVFTASSPTCDTDVFAVTIEDITSGGIGRAVLMGEAVVDVSVSDDTHTYAAPASGITTSLASVKSGPCRIIWREMGIGLKRAVVLLQYPDYDVLPLTYVSDVCPVVTAGNVTGIKVQRHTVNVMIPHVCGVSASDYATIIGPATCSTDSTACCGPTWNCTDGVCVDPGDGTGVYTLLSDCEAACLIPPTWNCTDGACVDPGDGTGTYTTLSDCETACEVTPSWTCCPDCTKLGGPVCSDPGDGTGPYSTLAACNEACGIRTFNCVSGSCVDPGDGTGTYSSLSDCTAVCSSSPCTGCYCDGYSVDGPGIAASFTRDCAHPACAWKSTGWLLLGPCADATHCGSGSWILSGPCGSWAVSVWDGTGSTTFIPAGSNPPVCNVNVTVSCV